MRNPEEFYVASHLLDTVATSINQIFKIVNNHLIKNRYDYRSTMRVNRRHP